MVANLILKGTYYYCSNCRMRQPGIPPRCQFCEYWFSNYEEMLMEYRIQQYQAEIYKRKEDLVKDESDLFGTSGTQDSTQQK